jgi:hypothetical protein
MDTEILQKQNLTPQKNGLVFIKEVAKYFMGLNFVSVIFQCPNKKYP